MSKKNVKKKWLTHNARPNLGEASLPPRYTFSGFLLTPEAFYSLANRRALIFYHKLIMAAVRLEHKTSG